MLKIHAHECHNPISNFSTKYNDGMLTQISARAAAAANKNK